MNTMRKLSSLALLLFALTAGSLRVQAATPYANAALSNTPAQVGAAGLRVVALYNISNPNSYTIYVQMFNAATAGAVTVGSTTPYMWIAVPANSGVTDNSLVANILNFPLGLVVAATTTPTGGSAPASAVPTVIVYQ